MQKINIVGNNEKDETNKFIFLGTKPKISRIFKKMKLKKIFIYLNILLMKNSILFKNIWRKFLKIKIIMIY